MRKYLILIITVLLALSSCRIFDPSGDAKQAELVVYNYMSTTVYFYLEDGSFGPPLEYIVEPGESQSIKWESDHPLFTVHNGNLELKYWTDDDEIQTVHISIQLYATTYYHISETGTQLIVHNESNAPLWFSVFGHTEMIRVEGRQQYYLYLNLSSVVETITVEYTGYHIFSDTVDLTMTAGDNEDLYLYADAGAIRLVNNTLREINYVYITPSDAVGWGENQLIFPMYPDDEEIWSVTEGFWDIKAVDNTGQELYIYDRYVIIDQTNTINLTEFTPIVRVVGRKADFSSRDVMIEYKSR